MLKSTFENAWEHQQAEWKQEKMKILNALGGKSGLPIEIGKDQSILIEKPAQPLSHLGANEMIYASKIIQYNNDSVRGMSSRPSLVNVFCDIASEFKDGVSPLTYGSSFLVTLKNCISEGERYVGNH